MVFQMPPVALMQEDRDSWSMVVPLGMAITIVDCEILSELVVQTVYRWECSPQ
jgi:hypothetical protein